MKANKIAIKDINRDTVEIAMNREKSFIDFWIENQKIDTNGLQCIRTYGWGDKAILRVEYADFHKDYNPIVFAKKYLQEMYGYTPKCLNFNNVHYSRIGCSILNVYDVKKGDFNKYSKLPTVVHSQFYEKEGWGYIEFTIHNDKQCELSYEDRLYEYFQQNNNMKQNSMKGIKVIYTPIQFKEKGFDGEIAKYMRENKNTAIVGNDLGIWQFLRQTLFP